MTCCDELHRAYDGLANRDIQVGELPVSMRVAGKVAWYVYQGSYADLGKAGWPAFWSQFGAADLMPAGAPGDVYVCSPDCHREDAQRKMLTILWQPVR